MDPARKIGRHQRHQGKEYKNGRRILQLERPACLFPRGADRQQQPAQPGCAKHRAEQIGQTFAPRFIFAGTGADQAHRLEAEDRKDARHQVKQQPAKHGPAQREPEADRVVIRRGYIADRRAKGRHRPGNGGDIKSLIRPGRDNARQLGAGGEKPCLGQFRHQQIAIAAPMLGCRIIDQITGGREEMWRGDGGAGGIRNGDPHLIALDLIACRGAQGARLGSAPLVETRRNHGWRAARPGDQVEREFGLFRDA